jgi:hypothetical protein
MKQTKERVGKKTAMATSQITQRWTPPTPDTIKINVDVAFEKTAEEVLLRLFARNERGVYIPGSLDRWLSWKD